MERNTMFAKKGYESYGKKTEWKNFAGNPMPTWDELPNSTKDAWVAAASTIATLAVATFSADLVSGIAEILSKQE